MFQSAHLRGRFGEPNPKPVQGGCYRIGDRTHLGAVDMFFINFNASDLGNDISQFVDCHQTILAEVEGFSEIGVHQTVDAFQAIVNITERTSLLTITPDLDRGVTRQFSNRDFTA
jgi:hypothetical protein